MSKRGSAEWCEKIAKSKEKFCIKFNCDNCGSICLERQSHHKLWKRHFCNRKCYTAFRENLMPKEEHYRFGAGMSQAEKKRRTKARSILNHAIRDGKIVRINCFCGQIAQAHHDDYSQPLTVKWLCFAHHRQYHKEHPHLLKSAENREEE